VDLPWKVDGACFGPGYTPEDFYPSPSDETAVWRAQRVCASCPVRIRCRDHALTRPEPFGIWGGLSEEDRKRLHRRARHQGVSVLDLLHAGAA
jgi:WhiB family redox-sensing transcriptional regulator